MKFINSAKTSIKILTYIHPDRGFSLLGPSKRIADGDSLDWHQAQHAVEFTVFADRHGFEMKPIGDTRWVLKDFKFYGDTQHDGPYSYLNTTDIVITHNNDHRIIDWKAVRAKYDRQAAELGASASSDIEPASAAQIILSGLFQLLAIGLGALPGGGTASGVVGGLGGILFSVCGSERQDPPSPPDAAALERIFETVLKREFEKDAARKMAIAFQSSSNQLKAENNKFHDRLFNPDGTRNNYDITEAMEESFQSFLNNELLNDAEGTLAYSIESIRDPEHFGAAQWILPAYLEGIWVWLALNRIRLLKDGMVEVDGRKVYQISLGQLDAYRREVTKQREAFQTALDSFQLLVETKVKEEHLSETVVVPDLVSLINKSIVGTSSIDNLLLGLQNLKLIEDKLKADVESGNTNSFLPKQVN